MSRLTKTNAEFVAIFDADFIPQRNFLIRTMGFFSDPKIGIVQVPHAFYNRSRMWVISSSLEMKGCAICFYRKRQVL